MKLRYWFAMLILLSMVSGLCFAEESGSLQPSKEGAADYSIVPARSVAGITKSKEAAENVIAVKNGMEEQKTLNKPGETEPGLVSVDYPYPDKPVYKETKPPVVSITYPYPDKPTYKERPDETPIIGGPEKVKEPDAVHIVYPYPYKKIPRRIPTIGEPLVVPANFNERPLLYTSPAQGNNATMTSTVTVTETEKPVDEAAEKNTKTQNEEARKNMVRQRLGEKRKDMVEAFKDPEDKETK